MLPPTLLQRTLVPQPTSPDRPPRNPESAPGFVVVDKPAGWTSHDVVGRLRRLAGTRRVGHGGTLDPMATGVLIIGIGHATRLLGFVGGSDKDYTATIRLGASTVTDDAEGEVVARTDAGAVTDAQIATAIAALTGEINQVPSSVSAIKVDGVRSYARVRAGEDVALLGRPVTVASFDVTAITRGSEDGYAFVEIEADLTVSSGTYIRALARDLGTALGVGGYLTALRRTRVAGFTIDTSHTLDALAEVVENVRALPVLGLADAARACLASRTVSGDDARDLAHGRRIARIESDGIPDADHPIALLSPDGALVALGVAEGAALLRPNVVIPASTMAKP